MIHVSGDSAFDDHALVSFAVRLLTGSAKIGDLRERYGTSELDEKVLIWGEERELGAALAFLTSEDYYHAGQVAFIRMATNPEWDYYGEIFG